jgi:uncharacterized protein (DUF983 family)
MLVNKRDGVCRSCGGQMKVTDADDATLTVECVECGDGYLVETDAFRDGGIHYYPTFLASRLDNSLD